MQRLILRISLVPVFFSALLCLQLQAQGWERIFFEGMGQAMSFDAKPTPDGGYIAVGEVDLPTGAVRHFIQLTKTDAAGNLQWQKTINENSITYEAANSIWPLDDGYLVAGSIQTTPFFSGNIYLLRLDTQGDTLWTQQYEAGGYTLAHSLYPTADGGFIIGGSNQADFQADYLTGVVLKINSDGSLQWMNNYSEDNHGIVFRDVIPTDDGFLAVGAKDGLSFAARLDAVGDTIWTRQYPMTTGSSAYAAVEHPVGGFVITGHADGFAGPFPYAIKIDETGNQEWELAPSGFGSGRAVDITYHPDGGFVLCGSLVDFSFNGGAGGLSQNGFILKMSADGVEEWSRIFYDLDNDAITPQAASVEPAGDGGFILAGTNSGGHYLMKTDGMGNTITNRIEGRVVIDDNEDCLTNAGEQGLENWIIEIQQDSNFLYASTDVDGNYAVLLDTGTYTLRLSPPNSYWESCAGEYNLNLENFYDTTLVDFPAQSLVDCPYLEVDVATAFLRRCFDNTYRVNYCNYGTETVNDAYIELTLDEYLSIVEADIPYTDLGNNVFSFEVGDVPIGYCGSFQFTAYLDCDSTVIGQTHCVEAHIFPDTLCLEQPMPAPRLDLAAQCVNDSVEFIITNIGTSDMTMPANFIVIEDDVMYLQDMYQLDIDQSITLRLEANGATYRLETELIPGLTDAGNISITIEGCGFNTAGGFNTGFVNLFSLNDNEPFMDIDCRQNIGSYDPNDKNAFPEGYGSAHYIKANTDLEYLIRFQNTGTDTAFRVEVLDTLSALLNPTSIVPGAASHPYRFELSESGLVQFTFDDIMLPDSNVNEPASHGFVSFKISQRAGLPIGALIENSAAIVFDFNEPVITNTTFHTIGEGFIEVVDVIEEQSDLDMLVFPNPVQEVIHIQFDQEIVQNGMVQLWRSDGQLIKRVPFYGSSTELSVRHLPNGIYWLNIFEEGRLIGRSKLIKQ